MKKILFFCCCSVFVIPILAQTQNIDSLINVLNHRKLTTKEQILVCKKICAYYLDNDLDKVFEYSKKGIELTKRENDKIMESWFTSGIADCYDAWGKPDSALLYYQQSLDMALETDDVEGKAVAYSSIGVFYFLRGKIITALEYYLKALSFSESAGNKEQCMIILSNIGGIHRSLLDNERAVYYLEQAKEIAEEVDSHYGMMCVYYDLGYIAMDNKETDKALEYTLKVVEFGRILDDKQFEILGLQLLSHIYSNGYRDYPKAIEYAIESLHIAKRFNSRRLVRYAWIALSDIYFLQKDYKECEIAALKAWEMDSVNFEQGRVITQNIAFANAFMGNKNKAAIFLNKYKDFNTQYISKSLHETITDLETKYETEKKELRIATLEKEKQLYVWLIFAGGAVLLLAFGTLFYRHRMTVQERKIAGQQRELAEQKIKQLEQEKQLIATQAVLEGETTERSRLARDLHDGLGGLLSVVKLNLKEVKGYSVMDETDVTHLNTALDLLDESISELRRVAHHIMPESLMRYGLRVSLEDFCHATPGVSFQYYGDDQRLDSQLEVLIYRCAYELVNNVIKHACATAIDMQLLSDNGLVSLTVRDNGCGFDTTTAKPGTGLENIRARVSAFNGKIYINSTKGNGTEVSIEIVKGENS